MCTYECPISDVGGGSEPNVGVEDRVEGVEGDDEVDDEAQDDDELWRQPSSMADARNSGKTAKTASRTRS